MNDKELNKLSQSDKAKEEKDNESIPDKKGVDSPDAKDASEENIQGSSYGKRSYAYPDFKKKDDES